MVDFVRMSRVQEKERVPPDLSKAHENLETYLSTLGESNREDEFQRLRYQCDLITRRENELAIESNIKVEKVKQTYNGRKNILAKKPRDHIAHKTYTNQQNQNKSIRHSYKPGRKRNN
jgi:hypothetical protein